MLKKLIILAAGLISLACTSKTEKELIAAFENPPQEAKPIMIWQWMDGWVTKEGITADLEACAAA